MTTPYTEEFFEAHRDGAFRSAQVVIPRTIELCQPHHLTRVVDIGCGLGTWLRAWEQHGASRILGVDGDHVDRKALEIPERVFQAADLNASFTTEGRWDLAMSLEVAEHLRPESAAGLVRTLTALAPVVLFSAAIPGQGGTGHVNEQWPIYWSGLFATEQFVAIDCLRYGLWEHPQVEWWYQQNTLLFVAERELEEYPRLAELYRTTAGRTPAMVHPAVFEKWKQWGIEQSLRR